MTAPAFNNLGFRSRPVLCLALASAMAARGNPSFFVVLHSATNPASTVVIEPLPGNTYGAAARTDSGTVWNQLPYVSPTLNPAGNVGNPAANSSAGTYSLYAAPRSLEDSTGAASPITLGVAINYAGTTTNGFNTATQSGTNPSPLFGNVWRLTNGANSLTYTFSGLPTGGVLYDLYFYGAGASTSQQRGATVALATANVPPGGAASVSTNGVSSSSSTAITLFDAGGGVINQGATWNVIRARTDSSGRIVVTQSKHSAGQNWASGFQLVPVPVTITTQPPATMTGNLGGTLTLSVVAGGEGPFTYQWRKNGVPISAAANPSATDASLFFPALQMSDAGSYDVVVSSAQGSVVSTSTALTVLDRVEIPWPASSQIAPAGGTAVFAATVTGPEPRACQWYFENTPLSDGAGTDGCVVTGATTPTLSLGNLQPGRAAGRYHLVVTGAQTATSPAASLTLVDFAPPSIPGGNFNILDHGAVPDDANEDTAALQAAINAASTAGGGTVLVPPGVFLCGPITMRNRVHLRLAPGAVLRMLPMYSWPNSPYSTGTTPDFLQVNNLTNVLISGFGTIDGQGQAWWDRVDGTNGVPQQSTLRPGSTIGMNDSTSCAILDVSTLNPPNLHFGIKRARNVVVANATLRAPQDSPNTDGINLAGQNLVLDHCDISTGDDNIVINSGTSSGETKDIRITNSVIGAGHGCSIGSYTSGGSDGAGGYYGIRNVVVDRLTFNGTLSALTLKSSPGRGGLIQNLSYTNLTMNNVGSPFTIHCYYGTVGSPGATGSNGPTPATAAGYNANPPASLNTALLPEWRNITLSDIVVNGCTNYAVIWGLPNRPVRGVRIRNISYNGSWGIRVYNATDVVFEGGNTFTLPAGRPLFTTYNANIISTSPVSATVNAGASASFAAVTTGTSGTAGASATCAWWFGGAPLADGTQPDGTVVSGAATRTLALSNIGAASAGAYTFTASNQLDGYDVPAAAPAPASIAAQATAAAVLTVRTALETWAEGHGLDPAGNGAPFADPDGDGTANLLEFAFGLDPRSGVASVIGTSGGQLTRHGLPELRADGTGGFVARFVRRKSRVADGLVYMPWFGVNLTEWTPSAVEPVVIAEDSAYELVEVPVPALPAVEGRFLRVSVGLF